MGIANLATSLCLSGGRERKPLTAFERNTATPWIILSLWSGESEKRRSNKLLIKFTLSSGESWRNLWY
jgi:hypothetical protein